MNAFKPPSPPPGGGAGEVVREMVADREAIPIVSEADKILVTIYDCLSADLRWNLGVLEDIEKWLVVAEVTGDMRYIDYALQEELRLRYMSEYTRKSVSEVLKIAKAAKENESKILLSKAREKARGTFYELLAKCLADLKTPT
jgi:hypothetical protein